jgi:hypothetical protein
VRSDVCVYVCVVVVVGCVCACVCVCVCVVVVCVCGCVCVCVCVCGCGVCVCMSVHADVVNTVCLPAGFHTCAMTGLLHGYLLLGLIFILRIGGDIIKQ